MVLQPLIAYSKKLGNAEEVINYRVVNPVLSHRKPKILFSVGISDFFTFMELFLLGMLTALKLTLVLSLPNFCLCIMTVSMGSYITGSQDNQLEESTEASRRNLRAGKDKSWCNWNFPRGGVLTRPSWPSGVAVMSLSGSVLRMFPHSWLCGFLLINIS